MGLLDKIFKGQREISKEEIVEVPWHPLTRLEQLDEIQKESESKTVAIFKHSTRCGISRMVLRKFEQEYTPKKLKETKLYFLDLLSNREISNEIAEIFGVRHESPQLLIIRDGKVIRHESHQDIDVTSLNP